jgi:cell wall-associated NlpC family hydrolase
VDREAAGAAAVASRMESEPLPTWKDVDRVWRFLKKEERVILQLARGGKTPSDIAEIMHLRDRFHALDELQRAIKVARFFAKWNGAVDRLGKSDLSKRQKRATILYVRHRMSYKDIAKRMGYEPDRTGRTRAVYDVVRKAAHKLRRSGDAELADMVSECCAARELRESDGKARRAEMAEAWRGKVRNFLLESTGKVHYEWGAQHVFLKGNFTLASTARADCSGFTIEVLKRAGVLPKGFRDTTAQGLARYFNRTVRKPAVADLAFYGTGPRKVTHVAFYIGEIEGRKGEYVATMSGGRRGMKASWARKVGAALWLRNVRYRADFLWFRRVV